MSEPLTREQVEHICKHGVEDGHYFTRVGAAQSILATDATLRAQLAAMTADRDAHKEMVRKISEGQDTIYAERTP